MQPDLVSLYRLMLGSRLVEEGIAQLWHDGAISGEMHLGIGEEAIIAGVVDHLGEGDALALDHRGTAALVMRGTDIVAIIRECLGRRDGLGRGLGGHMHLFSQEHLAASSGIVGAAGPAACGFALANQQLRPGRIAVAFFGEGAMNQGMLLESLNLAACWQLPVLFVCKDNGMAITTASEQVTAGDLVERAGGLGVRGVEVDGADVCSVWQAAFDLIERARDGGGPGFLRAGCVRPEGHLLGDALLRIVRRPVSELKDRIGPLLSACTGTGGAGVGERATSLATITGMLTRAAKMLASSGQDPITRLRRRLTLGTAELEQLESDLRLEVGDALKRAVSEEEPA